MIINNPFSANHDGENKVPDGSGGINLRSPFSHCRHGPWVCTVHFALCTLHDWNLEHGLVHGNGKGMRRKVKIWLSSVGSIEHNDATVAYIW